MATFTVLAPARRSMRMPQAFKEHQRVTRISRSDGGGDHWAILASLIETCKMNGIDPQAYLADVLTRIVNRHPVSRIDELLPFAYVSTEADRDVA